MSETNQDLPPQVQSRIPPPTILDQIKKQYQDFISQAKKNPQLMDWIAQLKNFWVKFGFRIKLIFTGFIVLIIVLLGIRFGSTLASIFRPPPVSPPPLPNITPTPTIKINSELENIRDQLQNFPILLPDPAVPPVDPDIHLQSLPIED